jgi:hypothetical protein
MAFANIGGSIAGALVGGLFGGGGGDDEQTATQTQTNAPWAAVQPYLIDLYGRGATMSQTSPPTVTGQQFFPYASTTAFNPDNKLLQGLKGQLAYASNYLPGLTDASYQSFYDMLNAPNVAANPYVNQLIGQQIGANTESFDQMAQRFKQQLEMDTNPGIRAGAVGTGNYGGSRQGVAEGVAKGLSDQALADWGTNASRSLAQSIAQTQMGAYGQGLDQQARAAALAPQVAQLGLMPSQAWQDVGTQLDVLRQKQIDDAMARWNLAQGEGERVPALNYNNQWVPLQNLNNLLTGASAYGTSTTTSTMPNQNNTMANVLGGGLLGSSLGKKIGNWFGSGSKTGAGGTVNDGALSFNDSPYSYDWGTFQANLFT